MFWLRNKKINFHYAFYMLIYSEQERRFKSTNPVNQWNYMGCVTRNPEFFTCKQKRSNRDCICIVWSVHIYVIPSKEKIIYKLLHANFLYSSKSLMLSRLYCVIFSC